MEQDNKYINELNSLIKKTPKVSLLNASPRAFAQYLEFMTSDQLSDILAMYEFAFAHPDSKGDPFFMANYYYIRSYIEFKNIFEPIKVVDRTIYFCKN